MPSIIVCHTAIPSRPPWCSVAMPSAEANVNGGPMCLPPQWDGKEVTGVYPGVSDARRLPLYWKCVLCITCEGSGDWRALCLFFNELDLCVGFLWGSALFTLLLQYYYYKCHCLECCQSHSCGGTLQKSRFKTVAQLNADVCWLSE